jgi:hypothetical protein
VKIAILALVLAVIAPAHITLGVSGRSCAVLAALLLAAAEILAAAGVTWLAIRAIRRFRSAPWLRPAGVPGGAW